MTKILQFPVESFIWDWPAIEGEIKNVLHAGNASRQMEEHILAAMKKHFDNLDVDVSPPSVPFPASISAEEKDAVAAAYETAYRQKTGWTMGQLLELELRLYEAQHHPERRKGF